MEKSGKTQNYHLLVLPSSGILGGHFNKIKNQINSIGSSCTDGKPEKREFFLFFSKILTASRPKTLPRKTDVLTDKLMILRKHRLYVNTSKMKNVRFTKFRQSENFSLTWCSRVIRCELSVCFSLIPPDCWAHLAGETVDLPKETQFLMIFRRNDCFFRDL